LSVKKETRGIGNQSSTSIRRSLGVVSNVISVDRIEGALLRSVTISLL